MLYQNGTCKPFQGAPNSQERNQQRQRGKRAKPRREGWLLMISRGRGGVIEIRDAETGRLIGRIGLKKTRKGEKSVIQTHS